ncbi:hypothetical protein ACFQ88_06330 [Paenibacillus sp. NPDC056579]|uniref:hypothetical protein n=1 Tax=Paenibacillus sp. NPDC056579 TaxID=3345871 RepID=UPI00367B7AD0
MRKWRMTLLSFVIVFTWSLGYGAHSAYAVLTFKGAGLDAGGFKSWEIRSTAVKFVGSNTDGSLPSLHPRSTGNLIALDEANGIIYTGTYKDDVYRISYGYQWRRKWQSVCLAERSGNHGGKLKIGIETDRRPLSSDALRRSKGVDYMDLIIHELVAVWAESF